MFERLKEIANRVIALDKGAILVRIFSEKEAKDIVLFLQKSQLFEDGERSDGSVIGYYSDNTRGYKGLANGWRGKSFDNHITLYDTGDFYESMSVKVLKNGDIEISADGQKDDTDLFAEYGENIIGLTDEKINELANYSIPVILNLVRQKIQGTQQN